MEGVKKNMESVKMRELVENYKKIQLYAVNSHPVEEAIILELRQDLEEYQKHGPDEQERMQLLAKMIAYLEFGFAYEVYKLLFERLLELCGETKMSLYAMVDREAQYVKFSKANLQKLIIWKSEQPSRYCNKGDVVADMVAAIKGRHYGSYTYETERCGYTLIVSEDMVILKNLRKGIAYYLV